MLSISKILRDFLNIYQYYNCWNDVVLKNKKDGKTYWSKIMQYKFVRSQSDKFFLNATTVLPSTNLSPFTRNWQHATAKLQKDPKCTIHLLVCKRQKKLLSLNYVIKPWFHRTIGIFSITSLHAGNVISGPDEEWIF